MIKKQKFNYSLLEKCPYSKLFWSAFSLIRTEYREILRISLYSVRMRENADKNNSEYRHFLRSDYSISAIPFLNYKIQKKLKIEMKMRLLLLITLANHQLQYH